VARVARLLLALTLLLGAAVARADTDRVRAALASVRFVAYTPRGFDPGAGAPADPAALRADLALLRQHFDGLITYSCANGLDRLAGLAREAGFRAVVLGVWSPSDPTEVDRALAAAAAERGVVIGLALGNEGLFFARYDAAALAAAFARARRAQPDLALATSEPFAVYLEPARARALPAEDFLLPNVHPTGEPWFGAAPPAASVELVANVVAELEQRFALPVLVKETGLPSGPESEGFTADAQARFWESLARRLPPSRVHAFAYFEAFDAPWKPARALDAPPERRAREAYWGFFDRDGRPKPALASVPR
jgi:exo-beta-1,3-glucanase (GH17 family)